MVIFACKSDLVDESQVPAATGNGIGEPFNVGLIEVSATTSEGKSKMRNGLRWLLYKIEQRNRRSFDVLPRVAGGAQVCSHKQDATNDGSPPRYKSR